MDINVNEIVFEGGPPNQDIKTQFLSSGYFENNSLYMDRFLAEDKTIDLEKLTLAIQLMMEYLEFSEKFESPIHIFIRNMSLYFERRGIKFHEMDRIIEESSFILGYCKACIEQETLTKKVIILYGQKE